MPGNVLRLLPPRSLSSNLMCWNSVYGLIHFRAGQFVQPGVFLTIQSIMTEFSLRLWEDQLCRNWTAV